MAKKKVVSVTTEERTIPDSSELEIPAPGADTDDADGGEGLLGLDAGEGEKWTVHKEPTGPGKKREYCGSYPAAEISLDMIRDTFGGGDYRLTCFGADNRLVRSKRVSIIDLPKPKLNGGELVSRVEPQRESALEMMLAQMVKSQGEMMVALAGRASTPPPPGPSIMEIIQLMKAMQPPAPDKSPIDMLLEGLKLGKEMGGGEGDSMMSVLGKGLEALPLLAAQHKPAPEVARRAPKAAELPAAAPAPATETPAPEKTPAEKEQMGIMEKLTWLRAVTADLVRRAIKGQDPEIYAQVLLDNLPSFITEQEIFERMSAPDAINQLAQLNPAVKAHAEWFDHFRKAVLDSFDDDEAPGAGEGGEELGIEP